MIDVIKLCPFIFGPLLGILLAIFHSSMKDKSTGSRVAIGILASFGAFLLLQVMANMLVGNIETGLYN